MEMFAKRGGKVTSSQTYRHEDHDKTDRVRHFTDNDQFIDNKRAGVFSPLEITDIITSLAGISLGICDDPDDVAVHVHPDLADGLHGCLLCDPSSDHFVYHGGGNDSLVPVHGGKDSSFLLELCPVVKKVAETDKPRGGRRAAALTTPYLHRASWYRDLNASLETHTAEGGRSRAGTLPRGKITNWFSITKALPGPGPASWHGDVVISDVDKGGGGR